MRSLRLLQITCIAGSMLATASPSSAQVSDMNQSFTLRMDNMLRAAYCSGVLNGATRDLEDAGIPPGTSPDRVLEIERQIKSLKEKARRYGANTLVHTLNLPSALGYRMFMADLKGGGDYKTTLAGLDEAKRRNMQSCQTQCADLQSQCVVDCYAKFDETLANIHACMFLPSRLPAY